MVDLVIAGVAVLLLVAVTIAVVRGERLTRARMAAALAVAVLAAGTFAVTLYHSQASSGSDEAEVPTAFASSAPRQAFGTAVLPIDVPMGTGDKYPQGALWLSPPRVGTNAYTGDISLLCSTPGKDDKVQNCTGTDKRVWSAEPLEKRATIGPATGDPFTDPAACDEGNGVTYGSGYLELTAGKAYCLHRGGDVLGMRVPAFPGEQPLPEHIVVELSVLR
ncbi:hypothetical protein Ade02nite_66780 [Paractinoplanes deccanensis]|uniref:Uncharacterized protein n=1 Tax=Paractinoplanes deccanensis TaxID=113561 RepID=A0ABQ3YDF3_9ACTN|nr:hypothetical protein [Actinoplanes deccanensis]GID78037.1 hypothetical protein Ade02nite_66780 [Actinoplanes deccanensis]